MAAILEGVRQAIESGKALPKLEILFTVGEEAGLYGAKAFDVSLLTSKTMYVLDSPGRIGRIVNGAPGRALLEAQVFGKAAHAGNEPEKGIDAAKIMAEMLATMETGRLDENTTSNFSHLWSKTCEAMNVVCDHAILRGEMRSRSGEKLDRYEAYFQSHCREIAEKRGARVEFKRENTFLPFFIPEDSEMIQIVTESLKRWESNRRSTAEAAVWTAIFSIRRESPVSVSQQDISRIIRPKNICISMTSIMPESLWRG